MKYNVYLTAFKTKADIRVVDVPDEELEGRNEDGILEDIFRLGQNDFQPLPFPSVSMGDIVELDDRYFMVRANGFAEMTKEEFDKVDGPLGFRAMENINDIISGVAK